MLRGAGGCATVSTGELAAATSRRMSFIGSTLRTRGMTSKLFGGGGDWVNHSSVFPFQGSLPALRPRLALHSRLSTTIHDADAEYEGADRGRQVAALEPRSLRVVVDAARHGRQAGRVLDQEGQVEAHEHGPEGQLAEGLGEHAAG